MSELASQHYKQDKVRKSWRQKTEPEIRAIIQEYANPANDAKLTHWSAKRLIGAMLRVEHDYRSYNGFQEDVFYNPPLMDELVKEGRIVPLPVRRVFRQASDDADKVTTPRTELKYFVRASNDMVIEAAQYYASMDKMTRPSHGDVSEKLVEQEVLLWNRKQRKPEWIKIEPNSKFDDYFRRMGYGKNENTYEKKTRKSWKHKTSAEIQEIIQEYTNPAKDKTLTRWSAKRLIGALLRTEHYFEPYNHQDDDFYNSVNDALIKKGQVKVAPVRRVYRCITFDGNVSFEAELKNLVVASTPTLAIEGAKYWGAIEKYDLTPNPARELLMQELLLSGKLQYEQQKTPKWVKIIV